MVSTLALAATLNPLTSQETGSLLAQAMTSVMEGSRDAVQSSDLGFKSGLSILGAYIRPKSNVKFTAQFDSNRKYVLAAAGNDDAEDIDVALIDDSGKTLVKDTTHEASAVVSYKTSKARKVTYQLSNAGSKPVFACLTVLVDKDGWAIHADNVKAVTEKFKKLGTFATTQGYRFYTRPGSWCLYGGLIDQGSSLKANKLGISSGSHAVIGLCDDQADVLDLRVMNSNGEEIGSDSSPERFPVFEFPVGYSGATDITLKNAKGSASFALFGLLEKP